MSARTTVVPGKYVPKLRVRKDGAVWAVERERPQYSCWDFVGRFDTFEQAHTFVWRLVASRRPLWAVA